MKKIQTKIIILVIVATMGLSIINCIQSIVISRRSTITAIEKNLMETTELAALAAQKQELIQEKVDAYYMRFGADHTGR